ncbi:hypothetical protein BDZ91DRAFT_826479 [Kalaharituber pfeilii]|nr:hypothetical protein BDZ91DRAFT_826479 [Kalaharituber pfeilii]
MAVWNLPFIFQLRHSSKAAAFAQYGSKNISRMAAFTQHGSIHAAWQHSRAMAACAYVSGGGQQSFRVLRAAMRYPGIAVSGLRTPGGKSASEALVASDAQDAKIFRS